MSGDRGFGVSLLLNYPGFTDSRVGWIQRQS
jgi:hypothetical protein